MRSHRPVAAADGADQVVTIEPMDVMTFDDDGLITSMRAYWGPADAITTQGE
ncbi:hypothetical protein [Nocardia rhamnosiphila]|uniref:hypothetical protein n=1 Tax=Nocardia rhamnosiphila TaxID=426716 RepID=UPI003F4D5E6C